MTKVASLARVVAGRMTWQLALLSLLAAFSFGAMVKVALANHYHTAGYCGSGNGLVHGSSKSDGAFHARVTMETFCPNSTKYCQTWQRTLGYGPSDTTTLTGCNAFWNTGPSYSECLTQAEVWFDGVFDYHIHQAHC